MFRQIAPRPDLGHAFAALSAVPSDTQPGDRLAAYFAHAAGGDLVYANPRRIAEALGLAERAALRLLVAALKAGLVDLHWEVRCPCCGVLNQRGSSLGGLKRVTSCDGCTLRFVGRLDDEVCVSFSLHQRLRPRGTSFDPYRRATIDQRLGATPGHALLLLPEFQRLFPQQHLLPAESLDVTRAALLFTDLVGSTAIYARRGDPRAYHLVRLHFDALFQVADESGGLMVKTIGDAVMAAFQTPAQALRAALAMQAAMGELNERAGLRGDERLTLKVGLHSGPCLSVTLNERADYFGTTVNIAARVQGLSHGGDVVFTDTVCVDDEVRALLGACALASDRAALKGIDEPVLVHRLVLGEGAYTILQ
jgi:class 3 adenylate cyclase